MMCRPNLNPNVKPCNTNPCPRWVTGKWSSSCDSNCERRRQVTCVDHTSTTSQRTIFDISKRFLFSDTIVGNRECHQSQKPDNTTRCKLTECPNVNRITEYYGVKGYRWKLGAWKQVRYHELLSFTLFIFFAVA